MNTTQTRMIRGDVKTSSVVSQAPQIQEEPKILREIDEYAELSLRYQEEEKAFKERTKDMKARLAEMEADLKEKGKELNETELKGDIYTIEFKGRRSRSVDPKDLYTYLKKQGKSGEFFGYINVKLGELEDNFGAAIIDASGIVNSEYNAYSGVKVKPNKVV